MAQQPNSGLGHLIVEVSRYLTIRHKHSPGRATLEEWSVPHRQHTTKTRRTHTLNGIRNHDPKNRVDVDVGLRPRNRWVRQHLRLGILLFLFDSPGWELLNMRLQC